MSGGKLGESKKEAPDVFIFENVRRLSRCIHSGVISLFSTVSGGGRFPKRGVENGERRWLLPGLWLILEAFEPGDGTAIGATDAPRQERTMTTKDEVLKILARSQGQYVSGEDLARRLSLSRNAVWRAVKSLAGRGLLHRRRDAARLPPQRNARHSVAAGGRKILFAPRGPLGR